jgi:hypothetical protein
MTESYSRSLFCTEYGCGRILSYLILFDQLGHDALAISNASYFSLKMSWLKMRTGCSPGYCRPVVGLRSAQRMSNLIILALPPVPPTILCLQRPSQRVYQVWRIPQPGGCAPNAQATPAPLPHTASNHIFPAVYC